MKALTDMRTFDIVPRPANANVITCKWVYKTKQKADGTIERYKARVVARGCSQIEGVDYQEVFAPTAKFTTIRLICSLACSLGWPLEQADIDTAFLWSELDEDIYMEQIEGYVDPAYPDYVCKLRKSLYGLKQAPHLWYELLAKTLRRHGFQQLSTDTAAFVKHDSDGVAVIISVYVDDLLILARNQVLIDFTKNDLKADFKVKDLGAVSWILGIAVERDLNKKTILLHQRKYISDMAERFGQTDCAGRNLPYSGGDDKPVEDSPLCDKDDTSTYRSLVGSLLYASVATRPDISETVSRLCRRMQAPTKSDLQRAVRCLQYLVHNKESGIQFSSEDGLRCYVDSNWGGPAENRLSRSGYAILLNNGSIVYRSILQKSQALSSAEAEYMALCAATQDCVYILQMLQELGMASKEAVKIFEDNQACMALASKDVASPKLKHVDIRYHFVRTMLKEGKTSLVYCPTYHQAADILTKPTDLLTFVRHRATLMGLPASS